MAYYNNFAIPLRFDFYSASIRLRRKVNKWTTFIFCRVETREA